MSAHTTIHPQPHGSPGMSRFSDIKKKLVKKMEDFMTTGDRVNPTEEQLELAGLLVHRKDESRYVKVPFGSIIQQNQVSHLDSTRQDWSISTLLIQLTLGKTCQ